MAKRLLGYELAHHPWRGGAFGGPGSPADVGPGGDRQIRWQSHGAGTHRRADHPLAPAAAAGAGGAPGHARPRWPAFMALALEPLQADPGTSPAVDKAVYLDKRLLYPLVA